MGVQLSFFRAYSFPSGTGSVGVGYLFTHLFAKQNWFSGQVTPTQLRSRNPSILGKYLEKFMCKKGRSASKTHKKSRAYILFDFNPNFAILYLSIPKNMGLLFQALKYQLDSYPS